MPLSRLARCPRQKSYDLLLPFYWGPSDEPDDFAKEGQMLVKVKNRTTKTSTQELSHEAFLAAASVAKTGSGGLPNSRPKLLYILLDLGVPGAKVEVHPGPEIWTIHCVGHRKDVFGCRKMGVAFPAKKVFAEIIKGQMMTMISTPDTMLTWLGMFWIVIGRMRRRERELWQLKGGLKR